MNIQDLIARLPDWDLVDDDGEDVGIEEDEIALDAVLLVRARMPSLLDTGRSTSYVFTTRGTDHVALTGMLQTAMWEQQAMVLRNE